MAGNATPNNNDDQMNTDTYRAVMDFSTKFGFPAAAALTVMFTSLVMANGLLPSFFYAILTFVISLTVVKLFFSH